MEHRAPLETALREELNWNGLEKPAFAVVIPVVMDLSPRLLIEVRAEGISQAGDPCFPGGRIEPGETPAAACLRELREELGIALPPDRLLGRLPTVQTYLGSRSDVFVALVTPREAAGARPDPAEVAELLSPPLSFFLERPENSSFSVNGHTVWGMTAGAIRHLCRAWSEALTVCFDP